MITGNTALRGLDEAVPLAGIEPASRASEARVLSIKLQGQKF